MGCPASFHPLWESGPGTDHRPRPGCHPRTPCSVCVFPTRADPSAPWAQPWGRRRPLPGASCPSPPLVGLQFQGGARGRPPRRAGPRSLRAAFGGWDGGPLVSAGCASTSPGAGPLSTPSGCWEGLASAGGGRPECLPFPLSPSSRVRLALEAAAFVSRGRAPRQGPPSPPVSCSVSAEEKSR